MMYLKIDEEVMKKLQDITNTDYEAEGILLPVENINNIIEDLMYEIDYLQEKINDMEQDLEDNYRPISLREQVGISDRDFL